MRRFERAAAARRILTLPDGARVQSLTVDDTARPVQLDGNELRLTLQPGTQSVSLVWQEPTGLSAVFSAPKVELGAAAVNARVEIELPDDRWILWASGPAWGAAVLFWPYLFLVLVIAWLLTWRRKTPIAFYDWALLGLGLTQIPSWAALIVVGWFFAVAHRARSPGLSPVWFDLRQLALVGYTLLTLGILYAAVHVGLLFDPEMDIFTPGGGGHTLDWYVNRVGGTMPMPSVVSLPMWVWRVLMLAWALWLALRVIFWARWAWTCFSEGQLWKRIDFAKRRPAVAAAGAPVMAGAPAAAGVAAAAPAGPAGPASPPTASTVEPGADSPVEPANPAEPTPRGDAPGSDDGSDPGDDST